MPFPPHTVLALLKKAGNVHRRKAGNVHRSQLELETGPSESSPPSRSKSAARLLPDSAALTSEIFMRKLPGICPGATTIVAPKSVGSRTTNRQMNAISYGEFNGFPGYIRINVLVSKSKRLIFKLHIKFIEVPDFYADLML